MEECQHLIAKRTCGVITLYIPRDAYVYISWKIQSAITQTFPCIHIISHPPLQSSHFFCSIQELCMKIGTERHSFPFLWNSELEVGWGRLGNTEVGHWKCLSHRRTHFGSGRPESKASYSCHHCLVTCVSKPFLFLLTPLYHCLCVMLA